MPPPDAPDPILDPLNPAQREAVEIVEGPLLVLAGAGSGKTRVITHRIAHMIRRGQAPGSILGVTFTNKAAREMRERVWQLVGEEGVRLSTFHSFCAAFLRDEFPQTGRSPDFTIYDEGDAQVVVRRVLEELNLDIEHHRPASLWERIREWKNRFVLPDQALTETAGTLGEEAARVYQLYDCRLREANACDFDDLLVEALVLLRQQPAIRQRWQERITQVLVDEFQDTNPIQYELVRALTPTGNLCVTGDQDQSIYSWRGAEVGNFDRFLEDHPQTRVVKLEQNYRSSGHILTAATTLISRNRQRIPKRLWTEAEDGEPVRVVGFRDEYEEAEAVAAQIQRLAGDGQSRRDMAVFYRTNALSLPLERTLLQHGIPYVVVGGLEFFGRQEVKDLLAYLRFLANPSDLVSLLRIINLPPRGIGPATREKVVAEARQAGLPPGVYLRDQARLAGFSSRARQALKAFADLLHELDQHEPGQVADLATDVLKTTGYGEYWRARAEKLRGALDAYQNLGQLVTLAREFDLRRRGTLAEFLAEVALLTELQQTRLRDQAVSLMSLHSSKGLEFDTVFIIGVDRGLLPHVMAVQGEAGDEEERRLLHVGMTRARRRLILTWATARTRFGRASHTGPSPFLDELGLTGVERYGATTSVEQAGPAPGDSVVDYEDDYLLEELREGCQVRHPEWGKGVVAAIRGRSRGLDLKVVVAFEGDIRRTLILRHARLEILEG